MAVAVDHDHISTGAGNVWRIAAIKKGTYTITIFNGDGTSQSRGIVVVIPNSLPLRLHGTGLTNPVTMGVGVTDDDDNVVDVPDGRLRNDRIGSYELL